MLISILFPVKNTAIFLSDCLDSIIQQTEGQWELIAINDHSTDNSGKILQEFAQVDPRIKVFNNIEKGIIPALRLAYSKSRGQLITRMDSDDLMLSNKLEVLKNQLIANGPGHLSLGLVQYFSTGQLGEGYKKYQNWLNQLSFSGTNFQEVYKECVIPSPCWMVYREDLERCGAFRSNRYPEDYDLCFRFYEKNLKTIPVDQVLHLWRDYPTRTSRTHIHYADNRFLELKLHYFLKLDFDKDRPLIVWGAGKKGKWIVRQLTQQPIPLHWVCNNEKKIGKVIYGQALLAPSIIQQFPRPQFIIAVAEAKGQKEIVHFMKDKGLIAGADYRFFC